MSENKAAHLGFIQGAINRMAGNSLALKSVAMALTTAVITVVGAAPAFDEKFIYAALLPVILFWIMDARYLQLERQFRKLYDAVRTSDGETTDFDMNPTMYKTNVASLPRIAFSWSVVWYYATLAVVVAMSAYIF